MNVNDKIKQILIDKNLSPSVFADEIGVQRSSISHILSGRNRPSFDIIQKVIRRFPDLGYDWIMEDDNLVTPNTFRPATLHEPSGASQPTSRYQREVHPVNFQRGSSRSVPEPSVITSKTLQPVNTPVTASEKIVERILIFYTDGTFREYTPATNNVN